MKGRANDPFPHLIPHPHSRRCVHRLDGRLHSHGGEMIDLPSVAFAIDPTENTLVGRDPREMSVSDLAEAGHEKRAILAAIRDKCVDCSGGSQAEARRCTVIRCALWPFRMNHNPFREAREMSDEQRAAAAERLAKARAAKQAEVA